MTSFLGFLVFQHAHFKGSDELAVFEMGRGLVERGDLAVPPLRHTAIGADGRRYSYFAVGQAVLALPFYAASRVAAVVLPDAAIEALSGAPLQRSVYRFGGTLESTIVGLYAPWVTALLIGVFFVFERALGASHRSAFAASMLLAATTQVALHSAYFLRHSTEAVLLLGALLGFFWFKRTGETRALALGAVLAVAIPLVRVPASISGLALGGYLAHVLYARGALRAGTAERWRWSAAVVAPALVGLAIHAGVNELKWGSWLGSPMIDQQSRLGNPLLQGLAGLLLSPGSSVFVWSPLLLVCPWTLRHLARRHRAEAWTFVALAVSFVLFYARFDGWSGLWSAPGPRYLVPLIPVLMLPLGPWLDRPPAPIARAAVAVLALAGAVVQVASLTVKWGSVQRIAGYPPDDPDHAGFLFEIGRAPLTEILRILASGGPVDPWILSLWTGWPGYPGRPFAAALILSTLLAGVAAGVALARREIARATPDGASPG